MGADMNFSLVGWPPWPRRRKPLALGRRSPISGVFVGGAGGRPDLAGAPYQPPRWTASSNGRLPRASEADGRSSGAG